MSLVITKARGFAASAAAKTAALAAIATAAATSATATFAQATSPVAGIIAQVDDSMASGLQIAGAVVLGIFAIWGVKLLLKGK